MQTHLLCVSSRNGKVSHCLEEPRVQRRNECVQKTKDHVCMNWTAADIYTKAQTSVLIVKIYHIFVRKYD